MSDTLNKEYLLEVLNEADERYYKKYPRVNVFILGLILDIEHGRFDTKEPAPLKPITTKSALDKDDLLSTLKQKVVDGSYSYGEKAGFQAVVDLIEHGDYDLGVTYVGPAE